MEGRHCCKFGNSVQSGIGYVGYEGEIFFKIICKVLSEHTVLNLRTQRRNAHKLVHTNLSLYFNF
jgi:hypothetical protein